MWGEGLVFPLGGNVRTQNSHFSSESCEWHRSPLFLSADPSEAPSSPDESGLLESEALGRCERSGKPHHADIRLDGSFGGIAQDVPFFGLQGRFRRSLFVRRADSFEHCEQRGLVPAEAVELLR